MLTEMNAAREIRRIVNRKILPVLRDFKWIILFVLALLAFSLGMLAFSEMAVRANVPLSFLDRVYLSLQLFTFKSGNEFLPLPTPPALNIARFLAPVITMTSLVILVLGVFYRQYQLFALRFFGKAHVIICGMGYVGPVIARNLLARGRKVVIIEKNPESKDLESFREQGAVIITGDASDEYVLGKAQVRKARCLFAVTGDDEVNARIALRAQKIPRADGLSPLHCYIHIEDPRLAGLLKLEQLAASYKKEPHQSPDNEKRKDNSPENQSRSSSQPGQPIRLEFFNIYQIAGYCLIGTSPPFTGMVPAGKPVHILIIGVGRMGESLITHAVQSWKETWFEKTREKIRITFLDRAANEKRAAMALRYPSLEEYCELAQYQMELQSAEFLSGQFLARVRARGEITAVYVCVADETIGFSTGLTLHHALRNPDIPITVRTTYEEGFSEFFNHLNRNTEEYRNFRAFPLVSCACCHDIIMRGTHEIIARAIHDAYVLQQEKAGVTPEENQSMVPWSLLPDRLRDANRNQADDIWNKLELIRCGITMLTDWAEPLFTFSAEEVEYLARKEHERWMEHFLGMGYSYGPVKDDMLKTHPSFVPWNELPEGEKEKDRNAIRSLPRILKTVNLKIIRLPKRSG
jgi:hypothetical protein